MHYLIIAFSDKYKVKNNCRFIILGYHGTDGVDLWTAANWTVEFRKSKILVMVPDIFSQLLMSDILSMRQFGQILIDYLEKNGIEVRFWLIEWSMDWLLDWWIDGMVFRWIIGKWIE